MSAQDTTPLPPTAHHPPARTPREGQRQVAPNFITDIVDADLAAGRVTSVVTRFPPEPNGFLHVGHAKAICLSFGIAEDYGGVTYLRFDDTNPETEDERYVEAIKRDIEWLGFRPVEVRFASDYFPHLYEWAKELIRKGLAYVDSSSEEEIRALRGTVTLPGRPGPYRERSVEENLDLFERMNAGEFPEGAHVLRAKIDLASPNMKMRDPILYRILHTPHYRTGDRWKVYPMYDMAHPLSDAIEGITHSLCTLEFENNREIYDWLLDHLIEGPRPHQYEFARLVLDHTVVSKRKLLRLVNDGYVTAWDDPRMPTLSALRRRGVPPVALKDFVNRVGVAKANSRTDPQLLDHSVRETLNAEAPRVLAVLDPLVVELTNVPEGEVTWLDAPYWPHDVPREGSRLVPLTREVVIEREDFAMEPPKGYKRLAPGRAVRLRHGPVVRCDEVETDDAGRVTMLRCTAFLGEMGEAPEGVKVWATVHWVSHERGVPFTARLYDRLFTAPDPEEGGDFLAHLNPEALLERRGLVEPSVLDDDPETRYQFERLGYFWRDPVDGRGDELVFNRIVPLKDRYAKRVAGDEARRGEAPVPAHGAADGAAARTSGAEAHAGRAAAGAPAEARPGAAAPRAEAAAVDPARAALAAELAARHGLRANDADALAGSVQLREFFAAALEAGAPAGAAANLLVNVVARELRERGEDMRLTPAGLAGLARLLDEGKVTATVAKEVLAEAAGSGAEPAELVSARGLDRAVPEAEVRELVRRAVADHPDEVASYRSGKAGLKGFFVGQVMRASGGRADPALVQRLVTEALDGG
ncbi:MAG TPA: glutamine--tRNA ligase/YqeY domain fusion protein [Trueperaceae bacterium]|nr:glutamine--tRNA ligase/YqeY domain fusion protein [Trueperaceae bacterium]